MYNYTSIPDTSPHSLTLSSFPIKRMYNLTVLLFMIPLNLLHTSLFIPAGEDRVKATCSVPLLAEPMDEFFLLSSYFLPHDFDN